MALYEPRQFLHEGGYPTMGEGSPDDSDPNERFTTPDVHGLEYASAAMIAGDSVATDASRLELAEELASPLPAITAALSDPASETKSQPPTPPGGSSRMKGIPKPEREAVKNADGKYVCSYDECTEEVRAFGRKCEWNKHMDKHDRPYRCPAEGCEKLAGFTYSGGLLRHEREVHNKHGGPRNTFICPHDNCKRNKGKGFSRQENLNEHLRRVHTTNAPGEGSTSPGLEETNGGSPAQEPEVEKAVAAAGSKRKRRPSGDQSDEVARLQEEMKKMSEVMKRMQEENNNLTAQNLSMMAQLSEARQNAPLSTEELHAPEAQML